MRRSPLLATAIVLAGCATVSQYTADTTYAKLIGQYPHIVVASSDVPPQVRAVRGLTYVRHGDRALQLDLYLPRAADSVSPAIVLVHGGGWRSGTRHNLAPMAIRLAQRGYAAATVSYRLSPEARYPAAIEDVRASVRWVRAHAVQYRIDPQRIAIAGGSSGGQIASLVGVTGTGDGVVQAIVNIDGLSDFTSVAARLHEDDPTKKPSSAGAWFGGTYAEKRALWHEASPLFYVTARTPPVLFIGSGQARFSVGREEMVDRLTEHEVASSVLVLPDTPHSFWLFDPWLTPTVDAMDAFLKQHIGKTRNP
jgi:acetyl esterase/lipase